MTEARNSASQNSLYLDVTGLLALKRVTGIQKIVLRMLHEHKSIRPVVYSPETNSYLELSELPVFSFVGAPNRGNWPWIRRAALQLFWLWSTSISSAVWPESRASLRGLGRSLFVRFFRDVDFPDPASYFKAPVAPQDVWLLDIPKHPQHRKFLVQSIEAGRFRLHLYLYDLIPIDSFELLGTKPSNDTLAEFEDYMRVVDVATSVLYLSEFTRKRHFEYLRRRAVKSPQNFEVVYPPLAGALPTVSDSSEKNRSVVLRSLSLSDDTDHLLLAIAPFNYRKNLRVVLGAVSKLLRQKETLALVVVAPVLSDIDIRTVLNGISLAIRFPSRVRILNPVSDSYLEQFLTHADSVLLPSRLEGFGLPLVEAASTKCRVIASESGSTREIESYVHMQVVPPDSLELWSEAIREAKQQPAGFRSTPPLTSPKEFLRLMRYVQAS